MADGAARLALLAFLACGMRLADVPRVQAEEEKGGTIEEIAVSAPLALRTPLDRMVFGRQELAEERLAGAARIDRALGAFAGFSLFRRADSLAAHPTTQGASLRLKGPNASARALVLMDGLPIDNPFGGWVDWSAIPPLLVARVETVVGSGAGPFGDRAETGVIMIETRDSAYPSATSAAFDLRLRADSFGGRGVAGIVHLVDSSGNRLRLDGFGDASPGYHSIGGKVRGPADRRLDARVAGGGFSWRRALGQEWTAGLDLRGFVERRVNGLDVAVNRSRGLDAAARLFRISGDGRTRLDLSAWHRRRLFRNVFAIVLDEARSQVRPVLDQFRVPGRASGARLDWWRLLGQGDAALRLGFDVERRDGATHERFRNLGQGFTRLREAGGQQWRAGVYGGVEVSLGSRLAALTDLRIDWWQNGPGRRREYRLADGAQLTDARFPGRDGLVANGRAGVVWLAARRLRFRADIHSGFRIPTLNELYRPFRVGKDVTVANADLAPEHLLGAGIGMDILLTGLPAKVRGGNGGENRNQKVSAGRRDSHLSFSVFAERLRNGIGNVSIGTGPGLFPDAGFVPAGGALRERLNIPRIRNHGVELGLNLALGTQSRLLVSWLHHGERIRRPPAGTKELRGLRVAQSPRMRFHTEVQHLLARRWQVGVTLDYLGAAFEDDLNRRRLPAATPIGAWLAYTLAPNWKLRLVSDNLFNVRVVDRLEPTGLAHRARPRLVSLALIRQQG